MSHWADYFRERFGQETLEEEWGFVSFSVKPPVVTIVDLYIAPEFRKSRYAFRFLREVERIGRERECQLIWTQVWLSDAGASRALRANLACGFKMIQAEAGRIIMTKEIRENREEET